MNSELLQDIFVHCVEARDRFFHLRRALLPTIYDIYNYQFFVED